MVRNKPGPMQQERIFTVTSLAKQEKRSWRTSIFINGAFWRAFDTETIVELGLFEGQKLLKNELSQLDHALEKRHAVQRAVLLLSYRPRSTSELSDRLSKIGFSPDIVDEAIGELQHMGYLDDETFAQSWIRSRMDFGLYGSRRIRQELRLKGISDDVISDKLEENTSAEDEYERAKKLAESKLSSYKDLDRNTSFRRLSQFLLRRGYSPSTVYDVCKSVL
ncbi:MAG TPA: RecX family transcriptional regulator [Anaerolineae bacterium]|jgi:regulatory protein|nr:RecX family transcriptional regulator [Anaerolineae bacterium]